MSNRRNFSTHHLDATELGRSVYYLLIPPNEALQNMLTTFDRFYAQRPTHSRLPNIQQRRPMNNVSASETGGSRDRPMIRITKLMAALPRRPSSIELQRHPLAEQQRLPALVLHPTIRRCMSMESMPHFLRNEVL